MAAPRAAVSATNRARARRGPRMRTVQPAGPVQACPHDRRCQPAAGRARSRTRVPRGKAWRHLGGQAMPGGLLVRVPPPTVATARVWVFGLVFGVAVALASPAVPVVTGHVVVGPEQELFQPTR